MTSTIKFSNKQVKITRTVVPLSLKNMLRYVKYGMIYVAKLDISMFSFNFLRLMLYIYIILLEVYVLLLPTYRFHSKFDQLFSVYFIHIL